VSGRCGACGRQARNRRRAYVPDGPGTMRMALVCSSCFGGAVAIVPSADTRCQRCAGLAHVCWDCAKRDRSANARELLEPAIRMLHGLRRAHEKARAAAEINSPEAHFLDGKIEALDGAISLLETEGQGRAVLRVDITSQPAPEPEGEPHAS
jgi:hypothetical protein